MFRWNAAAMLRAIDLACVDSLTVDEVADLVGCSRKAMFNFYRDNRSEIDAARLSVQISDRLLADILDMWGEGVTQDEIATRTLVNADTVRRLVLNAEFDEAYPDTGADDELAALREAHPGRLYEDDIRALVDLPVMVIEQRQYVTPFSQDVPHRMALPAPDRRSAVTLARAA